MQMKMILNTQEKLDQVIQISLTLNLGHEYMIDIDTIFYKDFHHI